MNKSDRPNDAEIELLKAHGVALEEAQQRLLDVLPIANEKFKKLVDKYSDEELVSMMMAAYEKRLRERVGVREEDERVHILTRETFEERLAELKRRYLD